MKRKSSKTIRQEKAEISNNTATNIVDVHPLDKDIEYTSTSCNVPCDVGGDAFIPYWEKNEDGILYGFDKYTVGSIAGCGNFWICKIRDEKGGESGVLEPNIDVFFTEKDVERKLNNIKKTEDAKKITKWKRKTIDKLGE